MFIAVAGLPEDPSALQGAAALCGLTMMEARARCGGVLPRILVRQASEAEAQRLLAGLLNLGFRAFVADPRQIPLDAQRILARHLEWTETGFAVTDRRGARQACPFADIALIQPGLRSSTQTEVIKSTERKFSIGKALITGGLSFSTKVATTSERVTTNQESFILVVRAGGDLPGIMIYESLLGFQCLGAELKPTRRLNLQALLARLRALAPAPVDDRLAQPAFLKGLPQLGVDEVDLGLFLVQQALGHGSDGSA